MWHAWTKPDENGQRHVRRSLDEKAMHAFTEEFNMMGGLPGIVKVHMAFRDAPGGLRLETSTRYASSDLRAAHRLAEAWDQKRTLAECVVCGTIISPDKGRIARTCSPACRLALNRRKKSSANPGAAAGTDEREG